MGIQKSVEIAASPEKIWPFFVEPEKVMQWCFTFKQFQYTSDQCSGAGTPIYIVEQAGGPTMKMHFKITEYIENQKIAMKMISGTFIKDYEFSWQLEATPVGCRFTYYEEVVLPLGMIGRLMARVQESASASTLDKILGRLKTLVET